MFKRLLATDHDWSVTVLRLALGAMVLPHGAQKLLGWFGGYGLSGTLDFFSSTLGIPTAVGALVVTTEFFGGLALLAGALGRVAAVGVGAVMVGAAVLGGHLNTGFFMNWFGNQAGEGFEFHLLAIAIAVAVGIRGSGAVSMDHWLLRSGAVRAVEAAGASVSLERRRAA